MASCLPSWLLPEQLTKNQAGNDREGLIFRNLNEAGEWLEQAIAEG
jgi:hypothetical protein